MPIAEKTEHLDTGEKIVEIELERLRSFTNHPFKVQADSQMIELQDSIKKYGIASWAESKSSFVTLKSGRNDFILKNVSRNP